MTLLGPAMEAVGTVTPPCPRRELPRSCKMDSAAAAVGGASAAGAFLSTIRQTSP